jgi:hypothetical protein
MDNPVATLSSVQIATYRRHEYLWADGATIKKPIKCSAPEYVDYLMTWVQSQLDHESIFPTKIGVFPYACIFAPDMPARLTSQ